MKHLLDTHIVVWWLTEDRKLSKAHARLLERSERAGVPLGVSAITLWEIAKLVERGRIELAQGLDESLEQLAAATSVTILPLTARIAAESTRLGARFPSDPTDQLIAATARVHGLALVTVDQRIIDAGVVAVA